MSANLQVLLDSVDQGMLIVSPEGMVRIANQPACQWLGLTVGRQLLAEGVKSQLNAVVRGYVRLPVEFEMDAMGAQHIGDRLRLKIIESPVGGGYLIVVRNVSEHTRFDTVIGNFANLIGEGLQNEMASVVDGLGQFLVDLVPDLERRVALSKPAREYAERAQNCVSSLAQLAGFAQVFSRAPVLSSDRIQVVDLVSALLLRLRPLLDRRKLKFHLNGLNQELPVIYGSRPWLVEAFYGCVEHLLENCSDGSDLELIIRPYGDFLSFQIRNHGQGRFRHSGQQSLLPFGLAFGSRSDAAGGFGGLGLGMALCEQVVRLHHGRNRFHEENGDIVSFFMELPSGAPVEAVVPNFDAEQAQRYAQDLLRLMKR